MLRSLLAFQILFHVVPTIGVTVGWLNFLKSNSAQAEEAKWSVNRSEIEGKVFSIRKNDSASTKKNRSTYIVRVGFAVPFHSSDKAGKLPEKEQSEVNAIEDLLTNRLEKDGNAIHVLSVRGVEFQEFVFYAKEIFVKKTKFDAILKEIKTHKLQSYHEADPKWSAYDNM